MLVMRREPFGRLIDTDRELRMALFAGLTAELRRLTGHVEELHFLDLPGRLASRLLRLASDQEPGATSDVVLDWPYTQSDLASMIGGTRQTVNRLLVRHGHRGPRAVREGHDRHPQHRAPRPRRRAVSGRSTDRAAAAGRRA